MDHNTEDKILDISQYILIKNSRPFNYSEQEIKSKKEINAYWERAYRPDWDGIKLNGDKIR